MVWHGMACCFHACMHHTVYVMLCYVSTYACAYVNKYASMYACLCACLSINESINQSINLSIYLSIYIYIYIYTYTHTHSRERAQCAPHVYTGLTGRKCGDRVPECNLRAHTHAHTPATKQTIRSCRKAGDCSGCLKRITKAQLTSA